MWPILMGVKFYNPSAGKEVSHIISLTQNECVCSIEYTVNFNS